MKFVFFDQCELCTDKIIDILQSEQIPYKLESKHKYPFGQVLYDIIIDTTYEHWIFVQKIAIDKLTPYMIAEKSYALPSYQQSIKTLNVDNHTPVMLLDEIQKKNNYEWELVIKTKKSLLKNFIDKIKEIL